MLNLFKKRKKRKEFIEISIIELCLRRIMLHSSFKESQQIKNTLNLKAIVM